MTQSERTESKLYEMVVRGTDFEDEYEFEMYGEPVTAIIKPLVDDEFLPIAAFLKSHLDVDDDFEEEEVVSEAIDKVEEEKEGDGAVDVSQFDEEFVAALQKAAEYGIHGSYDEDGERVEHTDEEVEFMVSEMMGGYSVEIGSRVLEISGDVRDAEKFRGGRGSIDSTRNSE